MSKPFNDEPVEVLIPKLLSEDGKSLDLRLKYIGDDGLKIVAGTEALRGLEMLNLERNDIGPEGIRVLAESQVITGLVELHLERNDLGDEGTPGVSYTFAGNYENQIRSQKTLAIVLPLALFIIFLILYFQFNSVITTSLVFSGILVAWAGGFIMIWLYGQPWFLDFDIFGTSMRDLFQVHPINLSVAIWVGFLALFGIASDDGVVISTYLDQSFGRSKIDTVQAARKATIEAGARRVRPCLMTTATTILALIPVLTSTGRGSDIMVPMAIPSFGGMTIAIMTMLVVPVLYCWVKELKLRMGIEDELFVERAGSSPQSSS